MNQSDFDIRFSEIQMTLKTGNIAYDFKDNADIWKNVGELPLDKSFTKLAELYLVSDDSQKATLYNYCGKGNVVLENLWLFVRRAGNLIHSKDDIRGFEVALAGALLDGGRADFRDLIVSLVVVRFISERCGIDTKSAFDPFIQSASGNMRGILENVRDHDDTNLHLTVQTFAPPEWVAESVKIYGVYDMQTHAKAMREQAEKQRQATQQEKKSFLKTLGDLFKGK